MRRKRRKFLVHFLLPRHHRCLCCSALQLLLLSSLLLLGNSRTCTNHSSCPHHVRMSNDMQYHNHDSHHRMSTFPDHKHHSTLHLDEFDDALDNLWPCKLPCEYQLFHLYRRMSHMDGMDSSAHPCALNE